MNKNTLKIFGIPALAMMGLVACDNSSNQSADGMTVAKPVVTQITAVCDDLSLKNRLTDALQSALLDASLSRLSGLSQLQLQDMETKVRDKLAGMSIDLQNVSNVESGCQADVYFTPAAADLLAAETALASQGLSLNEQAAQASAQVIAGRVVTNALPYQIVENKAVVDANHPALAMMADLMVAAAGNTQTIPSQQEVASDDGTMVVAPAVSMRPDAVQMPAQNVSEQPLAANRPVTTNERPRQQQKPQTQPQQKAQPKPQPKRNEEVVKVRNPEKKVEVAEEKPVTLKTEQTKEIIKSEAKTEVKETPKTEVKEAPKAEPKAAPKAEPKPEIAPTAQPTKQTQITIVETNDTY